MNEHRRDALLPRPEYYRRLARSAGMGAAILGVSLSIGMVGYHFIEGMSWVNAYLNSAMLMGGMGPVDPPRTDAGKLFAGTYALYCGLVLLIAAGVVLAPVVNRFLHKFHLDYVAGR